MILLQKNMKVGHGGHFWVKFAPIQQISKQNSHFQLVIFAHYFSIIVGECTIFFLTIEIPIADYLALKKCFPIIRRYENFTDFIQPRATSGSEKSWKSLPLFVVSESLSYQNYTVFVLSFISQKLYQEARSPGARRRRTRSSSVASWACSPPGVRSWETTTTTAALDMKKQTFSCISYIWFSRLEILWKQRFHVSCLKFHVEFAQHLVTFMCMFILDWFYF